MKTFYSLGKHIPFIVIKNLEITNDPDKDSVMESYLPSSR